MRKRHQRQKAKVDQRFALLELLVVIVILCILLALLLPSLSNSQGEFTPNCMCWTA